MGNRTGQFCLLACVQRFFPEGEGAQAHILSVSTQLPYPGFCSGDCYSLGIFSFLQREEEPQARQSAVRAGRDLLPALFFGFSVLIQPLSRARSCPKLVGLERTEATLLALGRRSPEGLDHLPPPRALFTDPPSSAGLALGTSHCVLGDSLAPNSPGNSG